MQIKKILVPYDFSDHSQEALDWALELAEKCQATVELMHVIHILPPVVDIPNDVYADVERDQIAAAEQRLEAIRAEKNKWFTGCDGNPRTTRGTFSDDLRTRRNTADRSDCHGLTWSYWALACVYRERGRAGDPTCFVSSPGDQALRSGMTVMRGEGGAD